MSLKKKFKTDKKCEAEGVWLDYGEGQRIRIARAGGANARFRVESQKIFRKYRRQIQLGILGDDIQERIAREVYAKTIILEWEGVTKDDCGFEEGSADLVELNVQNAIALLENLPDLFADVQVQAQNAQLFLETIREEDSKN
jgi:hypothetical protein